TAHRLFGKTTSSLGAMYAFEMQQPATAQSKLNGLKTHYHLPADTEPYFEIHSSNEHESEKLLAALEQLSAEDQTEALAACELMAESLWNALTGIYNKTC
ncbi:MAG TPA: iron-containing redox enzyme family protein, partial [Anaerolineales bacterium]|nr:iron-containing redox enzyme family protein [Anaerolineales bacterium]